MSDDNTTGQNDGQKDGGRPRIDMSFLPDLTSDLSNLSAFKSTPSSTPVPTSMNDILASIPIDLTMSDITNHSLSSLSSSLMSQFPSSTSTSSSQMSIIPSPLSTTSLSPSPLSTIVPILSPYSSKTPFTHHSTCPLFGGQDLFIATEKLSTFNQTQPYPANIPNPDFPNWSLLERPNSTSSVNSISTKTPYQPILTKHILSITTEPIIPAALYPSYLTKFHENPINAEFSVANNSTDVLRHHFDKITKPLNPLINHQEYGSNHRNITQTSNYPADRSFNHMSTLIDYTTPTNNENTITPAFTGPLLNNLDGQLPNGVPYELMLSNPSMALLAISSHISQLQQDSQPILFPQGNANEEQLYRTWPQRRFIQPLVSIAHFSIPNNDSYLNNDDDEGYNKDTLYQNQGNQNQNSSSTQNSQNSPRNSQRQNSQTSSFFNSISQNSTSSSSLISSQRSSHIPVSHHLTIEEHQHAPVIPYFAPLGVGIGSYLRTERKLISGAHKTLEELQSRFFTIQAILLRHRLRSEVGGVQESILLPTHQYKEMTVYNADYDAKRRYELSKVYARSSYLMALVSRTVTDLHILTRIWDQAKEQMIIYQNNEEKNMNRLGGGMHHHGVNLGQIGHINPNTVGIGSTGGQYGHTRGIIPSGHVGGGGGNGGSTHQSGAMVAAAAGGGHSSRIPPPHHGTGIDHHQRGAVGTAGSVIVPSGSTGAGVVVPAHPHQPMGPGGNQNKIATIRYDEQPIGLVYTSPFPVPTTLSPYLSFLLPRPLFEKNNFLREQCLILISRQLPQFYLQGITEIFQKIQNEDQYLINNQQKDGSNTTTVAAGNNKNGLGYDVGDPYSNLYLLHPRDKTVEANTSKTVVSVHIRPPPTEDKDGSAAAAAAAGSATGTGTGSAAANASGASRRSTLSFESFNTYYGLPTERALGYQFNPLIRPSIQVAQQIALASLPQTNVGMKPPKNNQNQAGGLVGPNGQPIVTLSQRVDMVPKDETDKISGLITLSSLVKQIDSQIVTHDPSIWSGKPQNLEQSFAILDTLYKTFPGQQPSGTMNNSQQKNINSLQLMQPAHHYFTPFLNHIANNAFDGLHTELRLYRGYHDIYVKELCNLLPLICSIKQPGQHGTPKPFYLSASSTPAAANQGQNGTLSSNPNATSPLDPGFISVLNQATANGVPGGVSGGTANNGGGPTTSTTTGSTTTTTTNSGSTTTTNTAATTPPAGGCTQQTHENMELVEAHFRQLLTPFIEQKSQIKFQRQQQYLQHVQQQQQQHRYQQQQQQQGHQ